MIMIMVFRLKLLLKQSRIQEYILPLVQSNINDSLVMLMEQDIPMNYEEAMVDLSTRNDYESLLGYTARYASAK